MTPENMQKGSEYVMTPEMSVFRSKLLLDNSASFTSSRMKNLSKMEGKTIFEAPTGCEEPRLLSGWKSLT